MSFTEPVNRPEHVLLNAYRVLHGRGAHRIQAAPYFYATGHWRCATLIDGETVDTLKYTNGMGWHLPGLAEEGIVDAEQEADAIWATLTPEQRTTAARPDPAYVIWFSALLDACGDSVPAARIAPGSRRHGTARCRHGHRRGPCREFADRREWPFRRGSRGCGEPTAGRASEVAAEPSPCTRR